MAAAPAFIILNTRLKKYLKTKQSPHFFLPYPRCAWSLVLPLLTHLNSEASPRTAHPAKGSRSTYHLSFPCSKLVSKVPSRPRHACEESTKTEDDHTASATFMRSIRQGHRNHVCIFSMFL